MTTKQFINQLNKARNAFMASSDFTIMMWRKGMCTNEECKKALESIKEDFDLTLSTIEMDEMAEDNAYQMNNFN